MKTVIVAISPEGKVCLVKGENKIPELENFEKNADSVKGFLGFEKGVLKEFNLEKNSLNLEPGVYDVLFLEGAASKTNALEFREVDWRDFPALADLKKEFDREFPS